MDIVALAREERVRLHLEFDEAIAGLAAGMAGLALAAQAQNLPLMRAGWDGDVERRTVRQPDPRRAAIDGGEEIDRQMIADVAAGAGPR